MSSPRFSVVIPTREGASTLKYTLSTCLRQEFDDYEVVVGDNCSSPATRQVVQECGSPRVRYVRSDVPLAMSSNWEFAVSHAAGQYVTVLGDDDALLPHALRVLDHLIRHTAARAVRWNAAFYLWPTIALAEEANYLRLPTGGEIDVRDARRAISSVIHFEQCYSTLPMLYNSVVERRLLDELRAKTGRLFLTRYPDVCSGFLVAAALENFVSSGVPMSIAGLSHKSVGVGHHMIPTQNAIGREFLRLNDGEGLRPRRLVPDLHVFPVVPVADCFLAVKEALFPDDKELELDRRKVAYHCVSCLRTQSEEHWRQCLATIRETLADDAESLAWFDDHVAGLPPEVSGHLPLRRAALGFDSQYLHLDTAGFGVRDVCGAAELCERLLGWRGADLATRCGDVGEPKDEDSLLREKDEALGRAHRELQEKEAIIQGLATECQARLEVVRNLQEQLAAVTSPAVPPAASSLPGLMGRVLQRLRWRGVA